MVINVAWIPTQVVKTVKLNQMNMPVTVTVKQMNNAKQQAVTTSATKINVD